MSDDNFSGKAKGGHARRDALSPEQRSEIAKKAAEARWNSEPLNVVEDIETGDKLILYTKPDGVEFQLRFEGEEPWATQEQIAQLFNVTRSMVTRHIKALYKDAEIDEETTCSFFEHVGETGQKYRTKIYNLDVILGVGYRVQASKQATIFRRWATQTLRQYLMNGFVIDTPRMKDPERNDRLDELLEIIEEIRASEANVWKQILDLVSYCSDYHAMTKNEKSNYFATFQNAMHWAVASATAQEIRHERVDASLPYAGLTSFEGEQPKVKDGKFAKGFLGKDEIRRLQTITNLALRFLKSQAEQGRLVSVAQYTEKLREIVKLDGRPMIPEGHKGTISKKQADEKVSREIQAYNLRLKLEKDKKNEMALAEIVEEARHLTDQKRARRKKQ